MRARVVMEISHARILLLRACARKANGDANEPFSRFNCASMRAILRYMRSSKRASNKSGKNNDGDSQKNARLQTPFVYASLPPTPDAQSVADLSGSLLVCLIIGMLALIAEILIAFAQLLSDAAAVFCLVWHTIACALLVKFVVDVHMVAHFWISLALFSAPPLFLQLFVFIQSLNKRLLI